MGKNVFRADGTARGGQGEATGAPSPFLDQSELAEFLNISVRTIERMRSDGTGPAFRKFGKRCLYHRDDVTAWADSCKRTSTSEAA